MIFKIFTWVVVLAALIVGTLTIVLPRDQMVSLIIFRDFFDVSLPILGCGALIKYLCTGRGCNCNCNCDRCNKK